MEKKILIINASEREEVFPEKDAQFFNDISAELPEKPGCDSCETENRVDEPEDAKATFVMSDFAYKGRAELRRIEELLIYSRTLDMDEYIGIVIICEEKAADWIASFMSVLLCDISIPAIVISSKDAAVLLKKTRKVIEGGLASNVYRAKAQHDGDAVLYLGTRIISSDKNTFRINRKNKDNKKLYKRFEKLSGNRFYSRVIFMNTIKSLDSNVLFVNEYPGTDYSKLPLFGVKAVVFSGLSSDVVPEYLAYECYKRGIPVFAGANMTAKMLYAKTVIGVSIGFRGKDLAKFIEEEINNEVII